VILALLSPALDDVWAQLLRPLSVVHPIHATGIDGSRFTDEDAEQP
jgi:hypothetical protein